MGKDLIRKGLKERIKRGRLAIANARSQGKDTTEWERRIALLERQMVKESVGKVKVKMGLFGFCTCFISRGLCSGCWKIKQSCACKQLEVNPDEVINQQYTSFIRRTNIH